MKKFIIILALILCYSHSIGAQVGLSIKNDKTPQYNGLLSKKNGTFNTNLTTANFSQKTKPQPVPSVFSVEALPFFCKIEYKMGLNKKVPLKFRLGSVQYVDELEGKGH